MTALQPALHDNSGAMRGCPTVRALASILLRLVMRISRTKANTTVKMGRWLVGMLQRTSLVRKLARRFVRRQQQQAARFP